MSSRTIAKAAPVAPIAVHGADIPNAGANNILDELINKLSKKLKGTTIAWIFPSDKLYSLEYRKYYYPGIVLIAKPLKKINPKTAYYGRLHKPKYFRLLTG
jgi:hypothetical protein